MLTPSINSRLARVGSVIEENPHFSFEAFVLLHIVVWTLLPALLYHNLPADIVEGLIYGREWQLGYPKLSPLPWLTIEAANRVFNVDFVYYALGQISAAIAFLFVWMMARTLVGALGAVCAILILDGQYFMNFLTFKFNHNVIQLPFWALAGYCYWSALRTGRHSHWLLFGIAIGGAFWAKYFVVVLAVPLIVFMLVDVDARRNWANRGPWLALGAALLVAAPHLVWLFRNNFAPYDYINSVSAPYTAATDHIVYPLRFLIEQLTILIPCSIIALPLLRSRVVNPTQPVGAYDQRILSVLAFGPVVTVLLMSLVSGRGLHSAWGYPLWIFAGLWLVVVINKKLEARLVARVLLLWGVVSVCFAIWFIGDLSAMPRFDHVYRYFPGDRLGAEISDRFREATGEQLAYVVGDRYVGGNIAHYAPDQPRLLILGDFRQSPWIDVGDLKRRGAAIVWAKTNNVDPPKVWVSADMDTVPSEFAAVAKDAKIQQSFSIPFRSNKGMLYVGWALLRPE
jgi:hypothetical protein